MQSQPVFLRPETVLHIYYLEGILPPDLHVPVEYFVGNWVEDDFSFLFFRKSAKETVETLLSDYPNIKLLDKYEMSYEQWQGGAVEPVRLGRFLLNPPWIKASPQKGEIAITLDSGVVFGNGAHPTTQACLEAIELACAGGKVQTMLDLGSGTGILSLAAARLGCRRILSVDYNFLASQTTRTNVILNDLKNQIFVVNGKAEDHTAVATDLLVANIHYDVMKDLIRTEGFLKQKWFILSGLLRSETEKVSAFLSTQPVHILKRWNNDNTWNTLLGITRE
jgi:ribosomal protein L11 methyltransferase